MSNATQDSRNPGDSRRRRSRGGKNRRNNHSNEDQQPRREGNNDRGQHQGRRHEGGRSQHSEEFRPQGASRPARKYTPVKLTLWQKILKAIGLYKEPARPARPERSEKKNQENQRQPSSEPRSPKSNTRNARTGEGQPPREPSGEKRPRGKNRPDGYENRPRGGDSSTVESSRVYVGNLSYDVTEQDLQELFKGIGGVRNVEVVYNRSTHRSKGYGFVEMLHVDEAKRAVEVLNDQHFMGRKMTVSGAKFKGQDERDEHEERPERAPRPVVVAAAKPVETVIPLQETSPEIVVEAAVENVAAVGAPQVVVTAVEHAVVEAIEDEPASETPIVVSSHTEAPVSEETKKTEEA